MRFFTLNDDIDHPGRWFLQAPVNRLGTEVDPRLFTEGNPVRVTEPLVVGVRSAGHPLDFTFADFDMPVVRRATADILSEVAPQDVQRIPTAVKGYDGEYEILNIVTRRPAIDERRSMITRWTEEDGWPEKVGKYFMVARLRVDPQRANGVGIFRLTGWEIAVVVSDDIRRALVEAEVTGVKFTEA
jgi:hypothetical protein